MDFINQNEWNVNAMVEVLETFRSSVEAGWGAFVSLGDWEKRNDVIHAALSSPDIRALFLERYRQHMEPYFREEFYSLLESKKLEYYADLYETTGEINIPLLKQKCLKDIATWSMSMESIGNSRYGTHRTVYPPGEAMRFPDTDPRKHLVSETNLTAIAKRHMSGEEAVQWIYQSPHLQLFVQGVMRMTDIYPYHSDLGVAVNIMRPTDHQATKNALAFHFDTIDSSVKVGGDVYGADNRNARGATGVIGIQDCLVGGERITFPTVHRENVREVCDIVREYNPVAPQKEISGCVPEVVTDPIAGMLCLFNGGDILHCVSSVREGTRVATVFLYCEQKPSQCESTKDSANAFYSATTD